MVRVSVMQSAFVNGVQTVSFEQEVFENFCIKPLLYTVASLVALILITVGSENSETEGLSCLNHENTQR